MRRLLLRLLLFVVFILLSIVMFRTLTIKSHQVEAPVVTLPTVPDSAVARLSAILKIPTISRPFNLDTAAIQALQQYLDSNYTLIRPNLRVSNVNRYGLLYKWEGKIPSLKPILLMAHYDVVPVVEETRDKWLADPFGGEIKDGYVWGRGALDDKSSFVAIHEALQMLLKEEFVPDRTIYFFFGQDEEVGGRGGAKPAAEALKGDGIEFEYILDEGLPISDGTIPGMSKPVALIGLAEKGYLTLILRAKAVGGHSSMPPNVTAVGMLSGVITRLLDNQMPARIEGPVAQLFDCLAPEMNFFHKMAFANRWLTGGLIKSQMAAKGNSNALVRTTTAPTMLESGVQENVLPNEATATINFRILPGETTEDVIAHVKSIIGTDSVSVELGPTVSNPTPVSPTDAYGYKIIQTTIRQVFPEVVVAPSLVLGATDARHFVGTSKNIYRFFPLFMNEEDSKRPHGINERVGVDNFKRGVQFYYQLIKNSGS